MSRKTRKSALAHVAKELHLHLPEELSALRRVGEYDGPMDPEEMLDPGSPAICGGLMPPDTIPLLDDGAGNKILARVGFDGELRELVAWRTDCRWHPVDVPVCPSPTAKLRATVEAALNSRMRRRVVRRFGWQGLADTLGLPGESVQSWLMDAGQIEEGQRRAIRRVMKLREQDFEQDWSAAEASAREAFALRTDLAWSPVVVGRALERRGHVEEAVEWYLRALGANSSTSDFVECWPGPGTFGYAADRIRR